MDTSHPKMPSHHQKLGIFRPIPYSQEKGEGLEMGITIDHTIDHILIIREEASITSQWYRVQEASRLVNTSILGG